MKKGKPGKVDIYQTFLESGFPEVQVTISRMPCPANGIKMARTKEVISNIHASCSVWEFIENFPLRLLKYPLRHCEFP